MSTVMNARRGAARTVAALDHALGLVLRPLANLLPRRLRRAAEKMERRRRPVGQIAAAGFLLASVVYGLSAGGQIAQVGDSLLVVAGWGVQKIEIAGNVETSESAVIEKLAPGGSLLAYDAAEAQKRVASLPWVASATVRKFYPGTLAVEVAERQPFALWQHDDRVALIDKGGHEITELDESRFGGLPFTVGAGANLQAAAFLDAVLAQPELAEQMRAAVYIAGRRWDLHLDNGVTVKLPEKRLAEALAQLVKLNDERQLLARDLIVVDLRLPDRVTVRLPEGRTLEEVTSEGEPETIAKARI